MRLNCFCLLFIVTCNPRNMAGLVKPTNNKKIIIIKCGYFSQSPDKHQIITQNQNRGSLKIIVFQIVFQVVCTFQSRRASSHISIDTRQRYNYQTPPLYVTGSSDKCWDFLSRERERALDSEWLEKAESVFEGSSSDRTAHEGRESRVGMTAH